MLVTFDSISSSLLLQAAYRDQKVPCRLIPVPRNLNASCGYAAEVEAEEPGELLKFLRELKAEWHGVYRPCGTEYRLLYHYEAESVCPPLIQDTKDTV
jgi:hypothetical protein